MDYSENESSRLIINIAYPIYAWKKHTIGGKQRNGEMENLSGTSLHGQE